MTKPLCPACGLNTMHEDKEMNALSRYVKGKRICSDCGVREAMEGYFWEGREATIAVKFPQVKVENMCSPRGKEVPNQFIIKTDEGEFFQSYKSIIAFIPKTNRMFPFSDGSQPVEDRIILDKTYWDYSTTTGKYRNEFLGEGIAETRKKIASGEYVLADLNQR